MGGAVPPLVVFLDRDGVLNELVVDPASGLNESPYRPGDVRVPIASQQAVRELRALGATLVVVSNQPAAAKGKATLDDLAAVDEAMQNAYASVGLAFDLVSYCHHHPDALDTPLGGRCSCRKPAPGLLVDAMRVLEVPRDAELWMIGDSDVDVLAGAAVGATTILVEEPLSAHRRTGRGTPDHLATSLLSAAEIVAAHVGHSTLGDQ